MVNKEKDAAFAQTGSPAIQEESFAGLGLSPQILLALSELGYETPSAIQQQAIPPLLAGRDVVGLAQTGTGKTAAFALPILQRITPGQKTPRALVLAPTRELALQVCEEFGRYSRHVAGLHVLPVYGGQGYAGQLQALRRGVDVVVGTPGRIIDHLRRGRLDLGALECLVLDEADEMLKMGFAEDVEDIFAATPEVKQVALFSATMPESIRRISRQHLRDAVEVSIRGKAKTAENIEQRYVVVSYQQKLDALTRLLEVVESDATIVFTRTRGDTERVAELLRARGYSAQAINGDVAQVQRERTVQALRDGQLDVLVATDVAARGLDVERIGLVVNYDLPGEPESYVHRIGRTGRAGRAGRAISFVTPRERRLLQVIERATGRPLEQLPLPRVSEVNQSRLARFDDSITVALGREEKIAEFREIVDHYVRHHDVPEGDVAAALALVGQGEVPLLLDEDDDRKFDGDRKLAKRFVADDAQAGRSGGGARGAVRRSVTGGQGLRSYRIEVGRSHGVQPGQIVGALAGEGGLDRKDFGRIFIKEFFSIVELPAVLSGETRDALRQTRVRGRRIDLREDDGPPAGGRGGSRGGRSARSDGSQRSEGSGSNGARGDRAAWGDRGGFRAGKKRDFSQGKKRGGKRDGR